MIRRITSTKYRHAYLLTSLLLMIVVRPFLADRLLGVGLIDIFLMVTLIAGAVATARSRRQLIVIGSLALLSEVTRQRWGGGTEELYLYAYLASTTLYLSVVAAALARPILRPIERVTADTIYGALSLYLLLGVLWAVWYAFLEYHAPGSFAFPVSAVEGEGASGSNFDRFLGFSFTTLTTLGYGNITPTNPRADALTTFEAVFGQIYLVVVVARLVAMQTTQGPAETRTGGDPPEAA